MYLIKLFKKLPTGYQRLFIVGYCIQWLLMIYDGAIPYITPIGWVAFIFSYWVVVLTLAWIYDGFKNQTK
jgi:hypothetical protein